MFNLCKTVKIYQVINHYHSNPASPPQEQHELNFQQNIIRSPQSSLHLRINTVDSHSIHPRKPRTGINLSIKQGSPHKPFSKRESRPSPLTVSQPLELLNSKSNETEFNSLKLKTTNRYDCDSPLIVESKITYGEMSPRIKVSEPNEPKHSPHEQELSLLKEIPLKREATRTTQESGRSSQPKIQLTPNPLKKSASFIRSSSISKKDELVKMSSIESSIKNSIQFKFSSSKTKRQDVSESLLRLSCSSYSQIPDKQINKLGYQSFSQTCSLQLKKDQSCFLKEYVCEVNQSIIIDRPVAGKELKIVKSNNDLLNITPSQEFKPSHSNIIHRQDSPVKKLKKRYGDNLLHPYDKQTIVSKSFASKSNSGHEKKQIIDQSVIIEHQIENKFVPIKDRSINRQFFRMFLAVQEVAHLLVTIKQIPINRIDHINQQLTIYRQIEAHSLEVEVSKLYQMYTHGCIYVLVKQPFELTLQEFIQRHCASYVQISWDFIVRSIQQSIRKTICLLNRRNIFLSRFISTEDIVYVFGEWKLHSPDMFSIKNSEIQLVQPDQAIEYLKDEIMGRIRETQSLN